MSSSSAGSSNEPERKIIQKETDLFGPLYDFLTAQGYEVHAEVNHCDITAVKGDELIVVEMKRRFALDLLYQSIDRQKITDSVYVALPGPISLGRRGRWRKAAALLRRLELGLIAVTVEAEGGRVEILQHPLPYQRRRLTRRKRALLEEMNGRSGNFNQGGSVGRKLVTAYRESAIFVACCLELHGPCTPARLRAMGTGPKTLAILSHNHYGWFQRVSRGVYRITPAGKNDLEHYPELRTKYQRMVKEPEAGDEAEGKG